MNDGNSAGEGQKGYTPASPAVYSDRRSNYSGTTQISNVGSAVSTIQMSRVSSNDITTNQPQQIQATSSRTLQQHHSHQQHQVHSIQSSSNNIVNTSGCNNNNNSGSGSLLRTQIGVQANNTSENNLVSNVFSNATISTSVTDINLLPNIRKRKLSATFGGDTIVNLKKRILEYQYMKVKNVKEKYSEEVTELYYIQANDNMMEYPAWRKKSNTPQFLNFMKSFRLDSFPLEEFSSDSTKQTQQASSSSLPHGAEIKIPGIGVTPVAVSTTLPAAVVQLSQQGHVPGRPQGGRHGMVFGQIPITSTAGNLATPLVPGGKPLVPDPPSLVAVDRRKPPQISTNTQIVNTTSGVSSSSTGTVISSQDSFSVKVRQEVYVMQRVSELQRDGMWSEKRLPKVQEPQRPKAHWDYLLEEMVWLATDFAQERKWKKAAAKKCARMVQKHFQDKALAAQRAEKAQELQLKRVASFLAKEIKIFWSNVEKLVEYKQQTKLEEKRKKALDQHLSFIVDQTEKFSQQLAVGMNKPTVDTNVSTVPSLNSSRISSPLPKHNSDDEFSPGNVSSDDDEETIAKAEEEATDVLDEVAALQKESEMELDAFVNELPKGYLENRDKIVLSEPPSSSEDDQSDEEFQATGESDDDEDTIMEQEQKENKVDHKFEIEELNAENNMSIEELMEKYKAEAMSSKMEIDSDDDSTADESDTEENDSDSEAGADDSNSEAVSNADKLNESVDLTALLEEDTSNRQEDDLINDAAAIAESIQPKGNTLSSTNVVTPVPFLLKHTLREYQHIGLDWLVTMHDRKLNGILADEMGLGKTIQTISLLAHLACVNGNWGPHLIVVPSSVMLNWEMEFKKWCPGFKILTYYGSQKERKHKRIGWTKANAFHICITSYKLVIQDHQSFRRKKWKYLILDEAQNIKNFKSQRWQLLLNFQTEQRLLLTGTPLQNNLMELWSLMHFLMPHVFQSHREFKEWFSNPMTGMIEGNSEYNESIIKRLHKVLRPFLLRRLKSEVEKQMPKKYEHVVMCRLSKRQRFLYDDFMSRANTRETLASGNLLSVINVLMQLRKVCNHPNMFEVRPTTSPFRMDGISFKTASLITNMLDYDPFKDIDLNALSLVLVQWEQCLTAYVAHRAKKLQTPKKLIEEIDTESTTIPRCPPGQFKMHIRIRDSHIENNISMCSGVKVGTSPAMKTEGTSFVAKNSFTIDKKLDDVPPLSALSIIAPSPSVVPATSAAHSPNMNLRKRSDTRLISLNNQTAHFSVQRSVVYPLSSSITTIQSGQRITLPKTGIQQRNGTAASTSKPISIVSPLVSNQSVNTLPPVATALAHQLKNHSYKNQRKILPDDDTQIDMTEFLLAEKEQLRKERRMQKLQFLSKNNQRKCDATPIYGSDLRDSIVNLFNDKSKMLSSAPDTIPWFARSYMHCQNTMLNRGNWSLSYAVKSIEERTQELQAIFSNFVIFVPAVSAPEPYLHVSHPRPSKKQADSVRDEFIRQEMSPKLTLLHPIISAMSTQFPDPRLIQYDCGKLQTLDRLLKQLKSNSHRVLIFTQMTRMLDVLEAFLNYHGHIYLRLDGTTRIEQRQILMDRFNNDKRIFVFILSTRSGGVGVNLTGADTVIFYDSDWNPTMDAQAQDRCHRIGQTRDVHIYRLVSERSIEENILKKANQKRLLGDLAIEGGNFTTAFFKSSTIQDLFNVNSTDDASARLSEVIDRDRDRRQRLQDNLMAGPSSSGLNDDKSKVGALESAMAAAEDEQDVQAAKIAEAEADADLAEFDESIPIEDTDSKLPELSKAEQEVENLVKQLSPIERYAMRFVEETGGLWTAEQLKAAEAEIEQQKREWEANRLAALKAEEEETKRIEDEEEQSMLTYSQEDARNQIWISSNSDEKMPMWCPPTPPQDDNDIYIDYSLNFLYESELMPESQLPPIYVKKDFKRNRSEAGFFMDNRRPLKIRKEDHYCPPRSLFDKPSPALAKLRKDLKLQRYRGIFKAPTQIPGLKQQVPLKPLVEPEGMAEWFIYEDMVILNVIQQLQGLPLNLMLLSPGHTPNWDLVADIVNQSSRVYRTPKQCRYRYEAVIVPREEGKLIDSPKKQKKTKNPLKTPPKGIRAMRCSQLYYNDNNNSFTKLMKSMFDGIKTAHLKKAPQLKQVLVNPSMKNPKHAAVLLDFGITNYDNPPTPLDIAARRVEKLKEKQRNTLASMSPAQLPELVQQQQTSSHQQQQQQQSQPVQISQPTTPTIIVQQAAQVVPTGLVPTSPLQVSRSNISHQQTATPQQIVKAIVTPGHATSIVAGQLQHIPVSQGQQLQHIQTIQQQQQQTNIVQHTPVSVVLSTSAATMASVQQPTIQPQIVSIQQNVIPSSSTIISQPASMIQTLSSATQAQVVSVGQLTGVSAVYTSAGLPQNATVATLTTSSLRAQRIVTAPNVQEVVLQQRPNSQSPTVVSVSGLAGQGVTPAQIQAGQLRLTMSTGQQVSNVVTKGIPITGKPINPNATQPLFFRPQIRQQQLKVVHPGQASHANLVTPTATIIQGGIVQNAAGQTVQLQPAGQKVSVATIGGSQNIVTTVATVSTVQMAPGTQKAQFVKQIGGKQTTVGRQVTEGEMLLVKRQLISQQQQKAQLLPQAQLFASSNLQVQQQPGTSGQQQIATLVKTSVGNVTTATGMTLAQVKQGQVKATIPNQSQLRQIQIQQQHQQQQIALTQQRKSGKLNQVGGNKSTAGPSPGVPTQLIVQNPKNLPNTVTVQQIQQVIRHAQPTGQIVLGKAGVGRVIPVSVASQPNARQIQVVSASSGLATATMRSPVATPMGTTHTIKVAAGTTPQQTQAIFTALQAHQVQRQNASPVRIQTSSGGSLVALAVQQTPPGSSIVVSGQNTINIDSTTPTATLVTQQQQLSQQQHQQIAQQQQQATQSQSHQQQQTPHQQPAKQ